KGLAGCSVDRLELTRVIPKEDQPCDRGHRASPGVAFADLGVSPYDFAGRPAEREQYFLSWFAGNALRAGVVVSSTRPVCLPFAAGEIKFAPLEREKIKQAGCRIVRRRVPVGGTVHSRTDSGSGRCRFSAGEH